ncbi:two component transcriptional regulator, LuxR family [Marinococcus luteus]|jgi:two-component system, NarL family, response regulator LiaR|uniref:Two component transcriptional regulator, LuxR family n=1 Tax=Marinococcus luteus TaxID=1122204 RepID=A0A1H2TS79_9BACI|nr:response regulator transcription factor [Marinococcus luteus]SDW46588.1 two component transcriptional regulator, LuxR family [Marinococcus luteus]
MITILFADDHEMVRIGVTSYLSTQPDMEVTAEASSGREAVRLALELRPDIILMDLVMDDMNGIEATEKIMEAWPAAKIIIVTSFIDDEKVYPALEAGAVSYILKTSRATEIAAAIRKTHDGQSILEPEVAGKLMANMKRRDQRELHEELTARELEVLRLLAEGKTNMEIAEELFIALKTAKVHVSSVLHKLQVQDRTQAVVYAYKHRLF